MLLTDAGQAALPELRDGFAKLARGVDRVRAFDARGVLTLSVEPSFAARWLVRRLDRFHTVQPDIDIRMDATYRIVNLEREQVDIAIRFGTGQQPGLRSDKLFKEDISPVCSPALLEGDHPLRRPNHLRWHTLLHDESDTQDETWPDWQMWLRVAGLPDIDVTRGTRFSEHTLMIEAAVQGQGVALAGGVVIADDLKAGRLVRPFGPQFTTPLDFSYHLVCVEHTADNPKIKAFRDWLLTEARS